MPAWNKIYIFELMSTYFCVWLQNPFIPSIDITCSLSLRPFILTPLCAFVDVMVLMVVRVFRSRNIHNISSYSGRIISFSH